MIEAASVWRPLVVLPLCLAVIAPLAGQTVNPLPSPLEVPGKVISDWIVTGDQDSTATPNAHMTRNWPGDGTTMDSTDYTSSLSNVLDPPEVDALANFADLFFDEVVNDVSTLLVSPREHQFDPAGGLFEIYFQTATLFGSASGPWAKNAPDIGGAPPAGTNTPPEGIDGLEVWGSDDDHNMFSLYDDPATVNDPTRGVSVFQFDPLTGVSSPYIYNDDLRAALGLGPGDPAIDLDGMMINDDLLDDDFGPGDSILFTVAENGFFHGGEIWVWDFGGPATFLNHGGVLWDTANQPGALFGWVDPITGAPMNDINALESILVIPEPSGLSVFAAALIGLVQVTRRRRH